MMDMSAPPTEFQSTLDAMGLLHTYQDDILTVHGDLSLMETGIPWPQALCVEGRLDIDDASLKALPDRLRVLGTLYVRHTPITRLPEHVEIHGDVLLIETQLATLPPNLVVEESLHLARNPITSLPPGLDIRGHLNIETSRITRLPTDLRVRGVICPPPCLVDLVAFMHDQPDEVVLRSPVSGHHRMELTRQLQPFPDLLRVVQAMDPAKGLSIQRVKTGYTTEFLWRD